MLRGVLLLVLTFASPALGWQFDVPHLYEDCSRAAAPPMTSGATVFMPVLESANCPEDRGELRLYALELASGVPRWRWELDGAGNCQAGRIVGLLDGDPVLGAAAWGCDVPEQHSDYTVRVDAVTGAERWRSPMWAWALHDDDVIAAAAGIVSRLDGETGTQVWAREFDEVRVTFADMGSDGVIVELWNESTEVRTLVRLDAEDGTERSRVDLGPLHVLTLDRAGHAITLGYYAVPEIVSLEVSTGRERWRFPYVTWWPDIIRGPSVVAAADGTLLLPGGPPHEDAIDLGVLALDPDTGTERWRWSMDGGLAGWDWNRSVVGLPDGDVLLSGSVTRRVHGGMAALARLSGDGTLRFFTDRVLPARRATNAAQARFIAPASDGTLVVTGEHYPVTEFSSTYPVAAAVLVSATTGARAPCGDGVVDPGEACDDANVIDGDGCDANCTATACGNGVIDPSEVCDPADPAWDVSCADDCTSALACDAIDVQGSWELLGWCSIGAFTSAEISWRNADVRLTQDCATGRVAITPAGCTAVDVAYRLGVGASVPTHRATGTVGCDGTPASGQIDGFALQVPAPGEEPLRGLLELDAPVPLGCASSRIGLTQTWSANLVEDRLGHAEVIRGTAALTFQPLASDGAACAAASPIACAFELRRTTPSPPVEPRVGPPDPPAPPAAEDDPSLERIAPAFGDCADLRGGGAAACALAASWSAPACDGAPTPPAVRRALHRAERLLARPGTVRRLRRVRARVQRAAARGDLSRTCARSVARALRQVRALLPLRAD